MSKRGKNFDDRYVFWGKIYPFLDKRTELMESMGVYQTGTDTFYAIEEIGLLQVLLH